MSKIRNIFLVLALTALVSLVSFRLGERNVVKDFNVAGGNQMDMSMMWKVKARLQQLFLERDKMNDKDMVNGAISGMVASLGDPYTVYLPPKDNKSANEDLAGKFGGVGISLGYKDKNLAVMTPLVKTPAERAGILAGDLILKITDKVKKVDKDTQGISLNEAVELIRGKVGTEVTLKMYREGKKEAFDVTLKREDIVVPSLELEWKTKDGKKVAWIKLYKFSEQLNQDWTDVVNKINQEKGKGNVAGIVLDLRNNPGGFLQGSVMVASDFIKDGVVVSQESSDGSKEKYTVDKSKGRLLNDKMMVLVNGGSASAAEILAGALKEYKRAKLVGEKTFGKGTVQQPEDFPDGSGLHVTIAKWLLPNGVNIHKVGVDPDVEVKYEPPITPTGTPAAGTKLTTLPDNQLDKAIEVLLKQ
jgi:carboxyl-terminal processing protease